MYFRVAKSQMAPQVNQRDISPPRKCRHHEHDPKEIGKWMDFSVALSNETDFLRDGIIESAPQSYR